MKRKKKEILYEKSFPRSPPFRSRLDRAEWLFQSSSMGERASRGRAMLHVPRIRCNFSSSERARMDVFEYLNSRHVVHANGWLSSYASRHTCQHVDLPASKSATCVAISAHARRKKQRAEGHKRFDLRQRGEGSDETSCPIESCSLGKWRWNTSREETGIDRRVCRASRRPAEACW